MEMHLLATILLTVYAVLADAQVSSSKQEPATPIIREDWQIQATEYVNSGRFEEAVRLVRGAIQKSRQRGEASHRIAGELNDLGTIYHDMDRLPEAARCYMEAVTLLKSGGQDPRMLMTALENLAGLRLVEKRYSAAERLYREAGQLAASEFGEKSPQLGQVLSGLAECRLSTGRYREARENSDQALKILENFPAHPKLGLARLLMSNALSHQGRYNEAETWMRGALDSWGTTLGVRHPTYASGLAYLGTFLSAKRPEEADRLFRQSLVILQSSVGENHSYSAHVMLLYSRHLQLHGRKKEAKEMNRRGTLIMNGQNLRNHIAFTVDIESLAQP